MNKKIHYSNTPVLLHSCIYIYSYLFHMTSAIRRRAGAATEGIFVKLDPEVKASIDHLSQSLGIPQWAVIEAAIRAARPGPNGAPEGWEIPSRGEELPIGSLT